MQSLAIYILAGGQSTRMGEDKAKLLFRGKPLLQHVLDVALQLSDDVFLLSGHEHHQAFNLPMVNDCLPNRGAAGGIDAMLQHSVSEKNLILSCDMPFVDLATLKFLLQASEPFDIVVPKYRGFPEPLLGIYNTSVKNTWRELILSGENKLSVLLDHFNVHYVDGNSLAIKNPKLFSNFNSKEDIIAANED
jgi:molybdopterin-guanine dinucleotide biosynthesis protein A